MDSTLRDARTLLLRKREASGKAERITNKLVHSSDRATHLVANIKAIETTLSRLDCARNCLEQQLGELTRRDSHSAERRTPLPRRSGVQRDLDDLEGELQSAVEEERRASEGLLEIARGLQWERGKRVLLGVAEPHPRTLRRGKLTVSLGGASGRAREVARYAKEAEIREFFEFLFEHIGQWTAKSAANAWNEFLRSPLQVSLSVQVSGTNEIYTHITGRSSSSGPRFTACRERVWTKHFVNLSDNSFEWAACPLGCGNLMHRDGAGMTLAHIVAVAKGGAPTPDNLVCLCRPCNSGQGTADARTTSPAMARRRDSVTPPPSGDDERDRKCPRSTPRPPTH